MSAGPSTASGHPPPVDRLLRDLRALDRAFLIGHHGRWSGAKRALLVDACLRQLVDAAGPPDGVAVVALGGYGRQALAPGSDVDLLIVHEPERVGDARVLAERLLYPLWDAGLRVGHAVRTPDGCAEVAAERLDAATALLDGRCIVGDPAPWASAHRMVLGAARRDPHAFARSLLEDADRRRARFGSVASSLEPELKEGSGGLRDAEALGWLEIALGRPLEDAGLVREAERANVETAAEFLVRVRSALHLETGRPSDRLGLEHHAAVAEGMGFEDGRGLPAVDGLMRSVFEHARQLEHVRAAAFDRYLGEPREPLSFEPTPAGVLAALGRARLDRARSLPAATLDELATLPLPDNVAWSDDVRSAFVELLHGGATGARALEVLDRLGLLERYLPAWTAVRCRPQRDPYHRAPVDTHLLETLAGAAALFDDPGADPLAAGATDAVEHRDGVLLGALLHDIGKTGEGGHVEVGARIARETLELMGVGDADRDLALFLVCEHLLLANTATRRDLEDEDLVLDVAARIGDPERLAALYLLTIADAQATGPLAWTPWRATLVRELVAKVQRVLERGDVGASTASRLGERADAIRSALAGRDPVAVGRFLERLPNAYLLSVPAERAARDFPLLTSTIGSNEVRTRSAAGARSRGSELSVVAADRPGLLSMIAGALSLSRLAILQAQVFTTDDGVALDLFEVEGAFEEEVGEERWREFRGLLRKAIAGRVSLEERLRDKRASYPPPRHHVPVRVTIDNEASDFSTVIEVQAADRLGLLFDLTHALAELGLDVHLAKVATYGDRIVDAFYVRDELGRKVADEQVGEIGAALSARLDR